MSAVFLAVLLSVLQLLSLAVLLPGSSVFAVSLRQQEGHDSSSKSRGSSRVIRSSLSSSGSPSPSSISKSENGSPSASSDSLPSVDDRPLFSVELNLELESLDPEAGLTVVLDRKHQQLMVNKGLRPMEGGRLAWGHYNDKIATTGWSELFLRTAQGPNHEDVSGDVKMYSAGLLEGLLTSDRMSQFHSNSHQLMMKDEQSHHSLLNIQAQFGDSLDYLRQKGNIIPRLATKEPGEAYWKHARYLFFQLWGLRDGYNLVADHFGVKLLSLVDLMLLNSDGEMPELMEAYSPEAMAEREVEGDAKVLFGETKNGGGGPQHGEEDLGSFMAKATTIATRQVPRIKKKESTMKFARRKTSRRSSGGHGAAAEKGNGLVVSQDIAGVVASPHGIEGSFGVKAARSRVGTVVGSGGSPPLSFLGLNVSTRRLRKKKSSRHPHLDLEEDDDGGDPLDDRHWESRIARDGRCSALVRLAKGNQELFVGHTTWADYSEMTRVWKYYDFDLPHAKARQISMSSYPGCISSTDDYYIMDSGLLAMETTLEILDPKARDDVEDFPKTPHLPDFMHTMILNRLSPSAAAWAGAYKVNNPGTYNSQWMVVDYNKFAPGKPLPNGTFFVVETMPGLVESRDMTEALQAKGYWASFNRPYFEKTRKSSGHEDAQKTHGDLYSYDKSPRGQIFAKNVPDVESLVGMRSMMTHNVYGVAGGGSSSEGDGLEGGPGHEISARMDLNPEIPIPNGGIDAKITNNCLFKHLMAQAISGPSHATQKAFKWTDMEGNDLFPGWPHLGLPDSWDFDWIQMNPASDPTPIVDAEDCGLQPEY